MGLDISYYKDMKFIREDIEDDDYNDGITSVYVNPSFPDVNQHDGMVSGLYSHGEGGGFRAGSYGGYNRWREQLCDMAHGVLPEYVWHNFDNYRGLSFAELIHFSDCEGVIGPKTSAKLAADFADWQDRAEKYATTIKDEYDREWFLRKYAEWRKAFEFASQDGAVCFH